MVLGLAIMAYRVGQAVVKAQDPTNESHHKTIVHPRRSRSHQAKTSHRRKHRPHKHSSFKSTSRPLRIRHQCCQHKHETDERQFVTPQGIMETTPTLHQLVRRDGSLLLALLAVRALNALIIQTSYVPDEYWQSLEVAHKTVFGYGHLTWEWRQGLRGFSYPMCFAVLYKVLQLLRLDYPILLIKGPCLLESILAAVADYYLYKWVRKLAGSQVAQWSLLCQLCHWFTFYTCTRTLSNSAAASLSTIALYHYPWNEPFQSGHWRFVLLVGLAVVVRPTAAVVWIPLCCVHVWYYRHRVLTLLKHYGLVAVALLLLSARIDKGFYGEWTNVYYNFLQFNVLYDLGTFYGSHPWHWYLTQGFPVVMATHLIPFTIGVWKSRRVLPLFVLVWTVAVYSYLGHKEFRFLSSAIPLAMYYCGVGLQWVYTRSQGRNLSTRRERRKDDGTSSEDEMESEEEVVEAVSKSRCVCSAHVVLLILLLLTNGLVALYCSLIHQRGTLDAVRYLSDVAHGRSKQPPRSALHKPEFLLLMPCHSTPYYSHVHANVSMRFLTCEPNLKRLPKYVDQADRFYRNPTKWLEKRYPGRRPLPSHILIFSSLQTTVQPFLTKHKYFNCARFFHTHFPDSRVGRYVFVFCKR